MWEALMDKTVTVQRASISKDAGGGAVRTPANIATNVIASIQSASSRDVDLFMRRGIVIDTTIFSVFDFDTKIAGGLKLSDTIIDPNGITYAVKSFKKDQNSAISSQPLYEISCERIVS